MLKISRILFVVLAYVLLFFLSCKKSPEKILTDICSHNLQIKLIPDDHRIIAKDTLKIEYREQTNSVYFFLHQSLQIEKIRVGNQQLSYEIIPRDKFAQIEFSSNVNDINPVNLYKIHLPKSLFPQNIQIWYQGVIAGKHPVDSPGHSNRYSVQKNCCIEQDRVHLPGEKFWYPSLPESKATYKLTSLTPADLPVITSGSLIFHEQRNDSLISIWEQKVPIQSITVTAGNKGAYNNSLKNNDWTNFNNHYGYFASRVGEEKKYRNFYNTFWYRSVLI
ncbi:hypothetical protein JXQ31_10490 [candidate division KSB1 bacterium]|nr:hypothetical protein [candidate division KSB1 bacterium]